MYSKHFIDLIIHLIPRKTKKSLSIPSRQRLLEIPGSKTCDCATICLCVRSIGEKKPVAVVLFFPITEKVVSYFASVNITCELVVKWSRG